MTRVGRRLRLGFGVLIGLGLGAAIVSGWETAKGTFEDAGPLLVAAVVLQALGLMSGAIGWSVMQPPEARKRAFVALIAAQPAKYLPVGGAFQLVGQIALTSESRDDHRRVGVAFLVHAMVQVCGATWVGLLLWLAPTTSRWVLAAVLVAVVGSSRLLRQATLESGIGVARRILRWLETASGVPDTRTLWRSWSWTLGSVVASSLVFAGLAGRWESVTEWLATMGVFAVAWVVGFLAVPFPTGLGARELVLVALLPAIPAPEVIAISVLHRFSLLLAELALWLFVSREVFVAPRRD